MDAERVRAQVDRILASAAFADAERAKNFLRFVVESKLAGRASEIKEFVIAVEVLGRASACATGSLPTTRTKGNRTSS